MNKELIEKIKNCKNREEIQELVEMNLKELHELDLGMVNGGTSEEQVTDFEAMRKQREEEIEEIELLLELLNKLFGDGDGPGEIKIG